MLASLGARTRLHRASFSPHAFLLLTCNITCRARQLGAATDIIKTDCMMKIEWEKTKVMHISGLGLFTSVVVIRERFADMVVFESQTGDHQIAGNKSWVRLRF